MIRCIAIPAALALMLGACATYNSGYYTPSHDGYGDYYYDNPQIIVDEHYPYWGGPYWGGYYGFGYGLGYFPSDCFGFQYGYAPGFCGGYYDPWWYGSYYHYRRHHHDDDHDGDDHDTSVARTDGVQHQVERFSRQGSAFGTPAVRTMNPYGHPGAFGDGRIQRPNPQLPNPWESRRESRQDLPRHHRDADGSNY